MKSQSVSSGSCACDVLVVGAGMAGAAAAVAAARAGAQTVLVERRAFPGGTAVAGMHGVICGLFTNAGDAPPGLLNEGLAAELAACLGRIAPGRGIVRMGRLYGLACSAGAVARVLRGLIAREKNLRAVFGAEFAAAERRGRRLRAAVVRAAGRDLRLRPGAVIDGSGEAVVALASGAGCIVPRTGRRQLGGFVLRLRGIAGADPLLPVKVPYCLARAAAAGRLPPTARFTSFAAGDAADEGYCKLSLPPAGVSPGQALDFARRVLRCLAESLPAFRQVRIAATSGEVLERDGPRLGGEYTLTERDVLSGRRFVDGAARGAWPVEFWDRRRGRRLRYIEGEYYEIPQRCLRSRDVDNLFAAGRCISASGGALASARVMGTCVATGEAAAGEALRGL